MINMCVSLFQGLLIILLVHLLCSFFIGVRKGRAYLEKPPYNPEHPSFYESRTISYTLAGFSLAIITLILPQQNLQNFHELLLFFILSFILFTISGILFQYKTKNYFLYTAGIINNTAFLSLISGFYIYLNGIFKYDYVVGIFYLLFIVLFWYDTYLYINYWKKSEEVSKNVKRRRKKNTRRS